MAVLPVTDSLLNCGVCPPAWLPGYLVSGGGRPGHTGFEHRRRHCSGSARGAADRVVARGPCPDRRPGGVVNRKPGLDPLARAYAAPRGVALASAEVAEFASGCLGQSHDQPLHRLARGPVRPRQGLRRRRPGPCRRPRATAHRSLTGAALRVRAAGTTAGPAHGACKGLHPCGSLCRCLCLRLCLRLCPRCRPHSHQVSGCPGPPTPAACPPGAGAWGLRRRPGSLLITRRLFRPGNRDRRGFCGRAFQSQGPVGGAEPHDGRVHPGHGKASPG